MKKSDSLFLSFSTHLPKLEVRDVLICHEYEYYTVTQLRLLELGKTLYYGIFIGTILVQIWISCRKNPCRTFLQKLRHENVHSIIISWPGPPP